MRKHIPAHTHRNPVHVTRPRRASAPAGLPASPDATRTGSPAYPPPPKPDQPIAASAYAPAVRPTVMLHARAPLNMLRPFLAMLEQLGFVVERGDYGIGHVKDPTRLHMLWGMSHRPPVYEELAKLPNVYFLENGWFTQRTGFYIDKDGPNGLSSIRRVLNKAGAGGLDISQVKERIRQLHRHVNIKPVSRPGEDYLFVPLQVERDTQLLYWSNAPVGYPHRQEWLVEQVCRQFPGRRIVIRPHPRDPSVAKRIKTKLAGKPYARRVEFSSEGTSYDWLASAKLVVGFNSTVLLEALTFFKPVAAMGTGLFESNGVMLQCNGDPNKLADLPNYAPDTGQITRFLALLWQRQIPYDIEPQDIERYPVLHGMLAAAGQRSEAVVSSTDRIATDFPDQAHAG